MAGKNNRRPRRRKNVSLTDDTIRGVPYIDGPPREPFPQLKSRQARNYRRELEAMEAAKEHYEYEESVFLLYIKLQNARKEGDSEVEAELETAFKQQVAQYTGKKQVDGESEEESSEIATQLSDNSLLSACNGNYMTVPSVVVTEEEPFTDRNGRKFLNSAVYNQEQRSSLYDTLNFTFLNSTDGFGPRKNSTHPVASTPFCPKQTKTASQTVKKEW